MCKGWPISCKCPLYAGVIIEVSHYSNISCESPEPKQSLIRSLNGICCEWQHHSIYLFFILPLWILWLFMNSAPVYVTVQYSVNEQVQVTLCYYSTFLLGHSISANETPDHINLLCHWHRACVSLKGIVHPKSFTHPHVVWNGNRISVLGISLIRSADMKWATDHEPYCFLFWNVFIEQDLFGEAD